MFLGVDGVGRGRRRLEMGENACRRGSKSAIWYLFWCLKLKWTTRDLAGWHVLECFSFNKIPEISITRMVLMILLEPVEHIDQGVFILGIFHFFAFELVLLRGRHRRAPPALSCECVPRGVMIRATHLNFSKDKF